MENYSYTSYPESGDSSPRSREIEFENPPPWDDQPQQNYKVKFMCSYGGKIHPRPHDNQLSYIGGETKILAVDRSTKFPAMVSKLSALTGDADVSFKYQLPGEDLDALISVTNDDDLDHMMHEYDRLFRATAKHARMRLFLFAAGQDGSNFGSDGGGSQSDRERFVDALNSGPAEAAKTAAVKSNVDFLFGLEKGMAAPPPAVVVKMQEAAQQEAVITPPPGFRVGAGQDDRVIGSDQVANHLEMQKQLQQEMQRMQIGGGGGGAVEQAMYRRKSDDNFSGGYSQQPPAHGDYYVQKMPEKSAPAQVNLNTTAPPPVPAGFWAEKQFSGGGYPATVTATPEHQPMYMIHTQGGVYHAPVQRPVMAQAGQGYYMQRMGHDVYNVGPPPQHQMSAPPPKVTAYAEGFGAVRPSVGGNGVGMVADSGAYTTQMAYDNATGRQVYYNAPGGVMTMPQQPQYQGVAAAVGGDMRPGAVGGFSQEGKMVTKVSQN